MKRGKKLLRNTYVYFHWGYFALRSFAVKVPEGQSRYQWIIRVRQEIDSIQILF